MQKFSTKQSLGINETFTFSSIQDSIEVLFRKMTFIWKGQSVSLSEATYIFSLINNFIIATLISPEHLM